jgi:hypothetical protein
MRYEVELLAHNGVAGKNAVEPFAGHIELIDEYEQPVPQADIIFTENDIVHEGRIFSYAYSENQPNITRYFYREKVETEPSNWAKAQEAEKASRVMNTIDPDMAEAN